MSTLNSSDVTVDVRDAVCRIRLTRDARRNALTRDMLRGLLSHVQGVAHEASTRIVVLEAEGSVFCAGMDLAEMQAAATDRNARTLWQQDAELYRDVIAALWTLSVPTLAAVQGPAVAGGVGLVAACDLVLASDTATFALPEPKRGLTAAIVTPVLVHRVGSAAAGHLLLCGHPWDADTAVRRGLCDTVVPPTSLREATDALVASVLTGSPAALTTTKSNWRSWAAPNVLSQLNAAVAASAEARETEDAQEGRKAFLEKRKPNWQSNLP